MTRPPAEAALRSACGLVLMLLAGCGRDPSGVSGKLTTTELLRFPDSWAGGEFYLTPDGLRAAAVGSITRGALRRYLWNGAESEDFDTLAGFVFNPDGKRWCTMGRQGSSTQVHETGKKYGPFAEAYSGGFSPDGSKFVFVAGRKQGSKMKYVAILEGVEGEECDRIDAVMVWSPGSTTLAYRAEAGGKSFFIVGGRRVGEEFSPVSSPFVFSPDGKRTAYVAGHRGAQHVVVDGVAQEPFTFVYPPVFSPDSKRLCSVADRARKEALVVDGKVGPWYDSIEVGSGFSPDSQRVAYAAREGTQYVAVADGLTSQRYPYVGPFVFSPDSRHIAFKVQGKYRETPEGLFPSACLVVDGVQTEVGVGMIGGVSFSPDGKHLKYSHLCGGKVRLIVDGGVECVLEGNSPELLETPDGKTRIIVTTPGRQAGSPTVTVNGKEVDNVQSLYSDFTLTPDGKELTYVARVKGRSLSRRRVELK